MLVVHCHSVINITGALTEQNNNLLQQSTYDVATLLRICALSPIENADVCVRLARWRNH